jgi:hypothetical protein
MKSTFWQVIELPILMGRATSDNRVILFHGIELLHHDRITTYQISVGI